MVGRNGIIIFLELIVDREGSFNTDKGIKMNISVDLVLTQKFDLNIWSLIISHSDLELSSKICFVQISHFIIHY